MHSRMLKTHLEHLALADIPASQAALKNAYRRQIQKWHPDKFQITQDILSATEKVKRINESFSVLSEFLDGYSSKYDVDWPEKSESEFAKPKYVYEKAVFTPGFPDKNVFEHFVKSSNIISIGYRKDQRTLYVKFKTGKVYKYFDVDESVFSKFLATESPGRFRNRYVDQYRYEFVKCSNVPYEPELSVIKANYRPSLSL